MIFVYHSNKLDVLSALLGSLLQSNVTKPTLVPDEVLVQNKGMAHWLQIMLAKQLGIAANIEYQLPSSFFWRELQQWISVPQGGKLVDKAILQWHIATLLPRLIEAQSFQELANYINGFSSLADGLHEISTVLADLFEQYSIYRPDWIRAWASDKATIPYLAQNSIAIWQSAIWKAVHKTYHEGTDLFFHRVQVYDSGLAAIANAATPSSQHPFFIFGLSALSIDQLKILDLLGKQQDIHIFYHNPCRQFWSDIDSLDYITSIPSLVEDRMASFPNPLLAAMGQQGQEQLQLLAELNTAEIEAFVAIEPSTLLTQIQHDILECKDKTTYQLAYRKSWDPATDRSLTIHALHSPLREVEVLQDALLFFLAHEPSIAVQDIVVMVSEIDHYIPFIQAVFGSASSEQYLPFSISDVKSIAAFPAVKAFLSLLNLPESRFSFNELMDLLAIPVIAKRWGLNQEDVHTLKAWGVTAGIRWGLDSTTSQRHDLPGLEQCTWSFGLERMLLGYAQSPFSGTFRQKVPLKGSHGLSAELVGKLAEFLNAVNVWQEKLRDAKEVTTWIATGKELLAAFFDQESQSDQALLALLQKSWMDALLPAVEAGYAFPISCRKVKQLVETVVNEGHTTQAFLQGKITFCTLMPMRIIPFKLVVLMGMNETCYPRSAPHSSLNLLTQYPRWGDRRSREEDNYLFLEAITSAEKYLYISYIGCSSQDNRTLLPSVLVLQLIDYIAKSHRLANESSEDPLICEAHMRKALVSAHPLMPFSSDLFSTGALWPSYSGTWLKVAKRKRLPETKKDLFTFPEQKKLYDKIQLIELQSLRKFYQHPVRFFFQTVLGISFKKLPAPVPKHEPFHINTLHKYELEDYVLPHLLQEPPTDTFFRESMEYAFGSGWLPQGKVGIRCFTEFFEGLSSLSDRIKRVAAPLPLWQPKKEIFLTLKPYQLTGWINPCSKKGLVRYQTGISAMQHFMDLWVEALVFAASGESAPAWLVDCHNLVRGFPPLDQSVATELLIGLLEGYCTGITTTPLWLFPKSSWAFVLSQRPDRAVEDEDEALLAAWRGTAWARGENTDPYLQRITTTPYGLTVEEKTHIKQAGIRYLAILQRSLMALSE